MQEGSARVRFLGLEIDNHVSIGHIAVTIMLIVSTAVWANSTDNKLKKLEEEDARIYARMAEDRANTKEVMTEIRSYLREISNKLDQKMDKIK
jgi:hypothetical protein